MIAAGNLSFGTSIAGGDGTDTLSVSAMGSAAAGSAATGFEALTIAGDVTVDLGNFGNNTFNTVNVGGNTITVQSIVSETINITAAPTGDLDLVMEDATGSADSITVSITSAAAVDTANEVTVAGVETVNLVMVDSNATAHQNTIDLELDTATTLNISGDAGLIITATGGTVDYNTVTTMDASGVVL